MGNVWRVCRNVGRVCSIALLVTFSTMGTSLSDATTPDLALTLQAQRKFLALSSEGAAIDAELYRLVELADAYSAGKLTVQEAQSEGRAIYRTTAQRIDALRARIQQTPVPQTADPQTAEPLENFKAYLLEFCDILKQSQSNRFDILRATLRGDGPTVERLQYRDLLLAAAMLEGENRLISVQSVGPINSDLTDPQSSLNEVFHASNQTLSQWLRSLAGLYEQKEVDIRKLHLSTTATRFAIAEGYGNALEWRVDLMGQVARNDKEAKLVELLTQLLDSFEKSYEMEADVVDVLEQLNLLLQEILTGKSNATQFEARADTLIGRIEQMTSQRFKMQLDRIGIYESMLNVL